MIQSKDEVEIKVGDAVWLSVGGPPMVVKRVREKGHDEDWDNSTDEVEVVWFNTQWYLSSARLPGAVLIAKPPEKKV